MMTMRKLGTMLVVALLWSGAGTDGQQSREPVHTYQGASPYLSVSLAAPVSLVPYGQAPTVILTVRNLQEHDISFPDDRLQVETSSGEAPTTLYQRQLTGALRPGEPRLRMGGFEPPIKAGGTYASEYDLKSFYTLVPGTYRVTLFVGDPVTHARIQSNTVALTLLPAEKRR